MTLRIIRNPKGRDCPKRGEVLDDLSSLEAKIFSMYGYQEAERIIKGLINTHNAGINGYKDLCFDCGCTCEGEMTFDKKETVDGGS